MTRLKFASNIADLISIKYSDSRLNTIVQVESILRTFSGKKDNLFLKDVFLINVGLFYSAAYYTTKS